MSEAQDFRLRWSSYSQQLSEALRSLLDQELLVDVTLACDGRSMRAHRAILSACSSYFQELFQESNHPHPIIILKDVRYQELEALVKFMYHGEVTVNHEILPGFLHTAETLHVRGLTDNPLLNNTSSHLNGCQSMSDEDRTSRDQDDNVPAFQRVSPLQVKRIKLEQSSVPQYQHPLRLAQHENLNDSSASDGIVAEQDSQGPLRSEELSHISSLDGLSQLVMPVIPDDSSHRSQYLTGVHSNNQNQQHQLNQPQHLSPQQLALHSNNSLGAPSGGASRPFRQRVLYNQEQLLQLEAWYRQDRYPSGALMQEYADTLAAMVPNTPGSIGAQPMRQNVDYWFQNRRRKDFHPEVMQQREKKKLAKSLWGNYNGPLMATAAASPVDNSNTHPENSVSNSR